MIIRDMINEDILELEKLYRQFWNEKSNVEKMKKQFEKLQNNDTHIILSAVEDNALIGSIMGIVCEELYGECKPFLIIENMIVDKSCRKKGIGKALILELENRSRERECTQIILVTETNRLDACRFYESVGFHKTANKGYKKTIGQ